MPITDRLVRRGTGGSLERLEVRSFTRTLSVLWLSAYGAVLLSPKTRVRFPTPVAAFQMEARSDNARVS